jgi:hypothetical protein
MNKQQILEMLVVHLTGLGYSPREIKAAIEIAAARAMPMMHVEQDPNDPNRITVRFVEMDSLSKN